LRKKEEKKVIAEHEIETNSDSEKTKKINSKEKEQQEMLKMKKNENLRSSDKFFLNLPLLRSYFAFGEQDIVTKSDQSSTKIGMSVDDHSCVSFVIILVLFILSLVELSDNINLKSSYVHTDKL